MIAWETVYPALLVWCAAGTGLPLTSCFVENEDRPFTADQYATVECISVDQLAIDDRGTVLNLGKERAVIRGTRDFVLRVVVWSSQQKQGKHADQPLERLRAMRQLPRLVALLKVVGCACTGFGASDKSDEEVDGHMRSQWVADLEMTAGFEYMAPLDTDAVEFIETVNGTSTVPTGGAAKPFTIP